MEGAAALTVSADLNVTQAAEAAWLAHGEAPVPVDIHAVRETADSDGMLPVSLLRLHSHRCIEAYFDEDQDDLRTATTFVSSLVSPGWQVTAVVPLHRLGIAHEAFRAVDIYLQAWWRDAEGIVRFSSSERA